MAAIEDCVHFTQYDLDKMSMMFADLQVIVDRLQNDESLDARYLCGRIYGAQEAIVSLRNCFKMRVVDTPDENCSVCGESDHSADWKHATE